MPTTSSVSTPLRDDAFGEAARVGLQGFERVGVECLDVVVVDRRRFSEDLFVGHRSKQLRFRDPPHPLLAQRCPILPKVCHELASEFYRCVDRQGMPASLLHVASPEGKR